MRVVLLLGLFILSGQLFATAEIPSSFSHLENSSKLNASICDESLLPIITVKNFWKHPKRAYQFVKKKTGETIGKMKYKKRLSYYKFISKHRGNSERLNITFADIINNGLEKKWITQTDMLDILTDVNKEGLYRFFIRTDSRIDVHVASQWAKYEKWDEVVRRSLLGSEDQRKWNHVFKEIELTGPEYIQLSKSNFKLPSATDDNIARLKSYIAFANGKQAVKRMEVVDDIGKLFSKNIDDSKNIKSFDKVVKKVKKVEDKNLKRYVKKHVKKNGRQPSADELAKMKNSAKNEASLFERLYHGCRSKRKNHRPDTGSATKSFNRFSAGASMAIAGGAYWYIHSVQNEEEWTKTHTKELMFDLISNLIGGYLAGAMTGGSTDGFVKTSVTNYVAQSGLNHASGMVWENLFGENKEVLIEAIDKLQAEDDFEGALTELYTVLAEHEELQGYIADIKEVMEEGGHGPEIFDTEEGQDLMLEVISKKMYHHDSQAWIKTGDLGTDYTVFHLAYFTGRIPLVVWTGLQAYNLICQSPGSWLSYAKAGGILLADRIGANAIYYYLRDKAIFSPAALKESE